MKLGQHCSVRFPAASPLCSGTKSCRAACLVKPSQPPADTRTHTHVLWTHTQRCGMCLYLQTVLHTSIQPKEQRVIVTVFSVFPTLSKRNRSKPFSICIKYALVSAFHVGTELCFVWEVLGIFSDTRSPPIFYLHLLINKENEVCEKES